MLIPAAGMGERLGGLEPKALAPLGGKPMLLRTLERFHNAKLSGNIVIIIPPQHRQAFKNALAAVVPEVSFLLVDGGAERQMSVANGLAALDSDTAIVVIHDAARPFVTAESIDASVAAAARFGAATVAVPAVDTVLVADDEQCLSHTPDRATLWVCQTPQSFQVKIIAEAHQKARRERFIGTDDATLVRRYGGTVRLVMGSPLNFKVTTPTDLVLAQYIVKEKLA